MRPPGISKACAVNHRQLLLPPQLVQVLERWVQAKRAIQPQTVLDSDGGPNGGVVGIADRRHSGQSVHATSQQHDQQPRRSGSAIGPRRRDACKTQCSRTSTFQPLSSLHGDQLQSSVGLAWNKVCAERTSPLAMTF